MFCSIFSSIDYEIVSVKMHVITLVLLTIIFGVLAQDCRTSGKRCVDHEQCCGGCCIEGECIDTYNQCYMPFSVCKEHACIAEEMCTPYVPPQCPGCEPIPVCRLL